MSLPLVVAVVLNWNLPGDTIRCVRSLLASDYAALRVLIVDNGSTDNSLEQFAAELPAVDVIATGANLYYGGGNNVGIRAALAQGAAWVLVLNNDTVVAVDMVSELLQAAAAQRASLVAPLIHYLNEPTRIWHAGAHWPRWSPIPWPARPAAAPYQVDLVTGCAMLLHAKALADLGSFDERYVMYHEDIDLCQRWRRAGQVIAVAPQAQLWHAVGHSAALASARSAEQRTRYRLRLYRQHTAWPWRPLTLLMVTGQLCYLLLAAALRGQRKLAAAYARGIATGWAEKVERQP
jgi:hypothetical protein